MYVQKKIFVVNSNFHDPLLTLLYGIRISILLNKGWYDFYLKVLFDTLGICQSNFIYIQSLWGDLTHDRVLTLFSHNPNLKQYHTHDLPSTKPISAQNVCHNEPLKTSS